MPILISYLVMIGIFVGGGVGTLYWLTAPEPTRVAVHHHPRPAVTSSSPAPEGREPSRLPTQSSEKPAEVTNAEVTHAADASRKVDEGVTTPDKPSTTPATTPDVATPGDPSTHLRSKPCLKARRLRRPKPPRRPGVPRPGLRAGRGIDTSKR